MGLLVLVMLCGDSGEEVVDWWLWVGCVVMSRGTDDMYSGVMGSFYDKGYANH